jgi:hypothetical protein
MPSFEAEPEDGTQNRDADSFGLFNKEVREEIHNSADNRTERNAHADEFNPVDAPGLDLGSQQMPEETLPEATLPEATLPQAVLPQEASPETEPDEDQDLLDDPFAYLDQPEQDDYIEEPTYEDIEEEPPDEDLSF